MPDSKRLPEGLDKGMRIYVPGHRGLIGSAFIRRFEKEGFTGVVTRERPELDLCDRSNLDRFFRESRPEIVILCAGRVGGIRANLASPADFMADNIEISLNVVRAAYRHGVRRMVLFGSSCMYPRDCLQPMAEGSLLTGKPEPSSLPYALSKLAAVYLCLAYNEQFAFRRFWPLIPNTVYGPNDDFDPVSGHVLPALIQRFHDAKNKGLRKILLWGTGETRREFIHADDVVDATLFLLERDTAALPLPLNIGTGRDYSIRELAHKVAAVTGFDGEIAFDASAAQGAPVKRLDSSVLADLGWFPRISLDEGLRATYEWFRTVDNLEVGKGDKDDSLSSSPTGL